MWSPGQVSGLDCTGSIPCNLTPSMLSVTLEPGGEIRMRLRPSGETGRALGSAAAAVAKRAVRAHLSIAAKSEKSDEAASGFGGLPTPTVFGSFGRRAVRNGCGALATLFGNRVVFGTITLPGSTPQALEGLARQSGRLIQLLTHWISSVDRNAYLTYVWEWQMRGALHLHFAVGSKSILVLRRLKRQFRSYCSKMFATLSKHAETDLFQRADGTTWRGDPKKLRCRIETIRKSVKAYMSKYLTKAEVVAGAHYPSRWWGMSAHLRRTIGELRCCSVFQSADWGCLSQTAERVAQALLQSAPTLYSYSAKFAPSIRTWLVYAPDNQVAHLFESIVLLCQHYEASWTGIYESRERAVVPLKVGRHGAAVDMLTGEVVN